VAKLCFKTPVSKGTKFVTFMLEEVINLFGRSESIRKSVRLTLHRGGLTFFAPSGRRQEKILREMVDGTQPESGEGVQAPAVVLALPLPSCIDTH